MRCAAEGELGRGSLPGPILPRPPSPGQGLVFAPSTPLPRLRAWLPPSQPPSPQPAAEGPGGGPYLGIDFCVLRRCAAAQAAQKHQEQRQQSRPRSRLPAAKETARPARPSGRAPVAAHALGA